MRGEQGRACVKLMQYHEGRPQEGSAKTAERPMDRTPRGVRHGNPGFVPAPPAESQQEPPRSYSPRGLAVHARSLAAKVAALKAGTWARNAAAELSGRAWQAQADAAVQASLDDPEVVLDTGPSPIAAATSLASSGPIPSSSRSPVLVKSKAATRAGTAWRFEVTHLAVPRSLQRVDDVPRSCCGWPFELGASVVSTDLSIGAGEVCETCFPGLARRIANRLRELGEA